jgi:hypothetical protein
MMGDTAAHVEDGRLYKKSDASFVPILKNGNA